MVVYPEAQEVIVLACHSTNCCSLHYSNKWTNTIMQLGGFEGGI